MSGSWRSRSMAWTNSEAESSRCPTTGSCRSRSGAGGRHPRWRGDGMLVAVSVEPRPEALVVTGSKQDLFRAPRLITEGRPQYAVLDNGERFLFNEISETAPRVVSLDRITRADSMGRRYLSRGSGERR